jgi:DNA-binding GntR family transcriptional regulator/transposase
VADGGLRLTPDERATLERTARSRQTPRGVATRAQLVVDLADVGVAEAARRASVSRATVVKWRRRYLGDGIEGLHDIPPTGRPPIPDDVVRRILGCALDDPPAGTGRWTTRTIAATTGVSQATVSRTRRRYFPRYGAAGEFLSDRTSILSYVGVLPAGCVLGFQPAPGTRDAASSPARVDAVETILCAAMLRRPVGATADATSVLRRAAAHLPSTPGVTLVLDTALDAPARTWLRGHPEITVHCVTGAGWLGLLHRIACAVDPGQLAELQEVQRRIRRARRAAAAEFSWSRDQDGAAPLSADPPPHLEPEPLSRDLDEVIRAICAALGDGDLHAAEAIDVRRVARRSGVSPGRVGETLARLAAEAIIEKHAGRYLLPTPTSRDIAETYTARGLLGTAITRRLASTGGELPPVVDEHRAGLLRCHELGLVADACSIDLDLQDELARAAAMPRIGSMFVRLTLQLRLFLAILGLSYRYPTDEIVADDDRILTEIRRRDPRSAVDAWRNKIDNCARYMLARV